MQEQLTLKAFGAHRYGTNTTRQSLGREQKVENYDKDPEVKSVGLDSGCEGLCRKCTDPQNS